MNTHLHLGTLTQIQAALERERASGTTNLPDVTAPAPLGVIAMPHPTAALAGTGAPSHAGTASPDRFLALIESPSVREEIARAVSRPEVFSADRMLTMFKIQFRNDVGLQLCEPYSLLGALIEAATLGLMPGYLGEAYIARRRRDGDMNYLFDAELLVGYRGLAKLAKRSGLVKDIIANPVTDAEIEEGRFEFEYGGTEDVFRHKMVGRRGNTVLTYCRLRMTDGTFRVAIVDREEMQRVRGMSAARESIGESAINWTTDEEFMWLKSAIRKALRLSDVISEELERAMRLEDLREHGMAQRLATQFAQDVVVPDVPTPNAAEPNQFAARNDLSPDDALSTEGPAPANDESRGAAPTAAPGASVGDVVPAPRESPTAAPVASVGEVVHVPHASPTGSPSVEEVVDDPVLHGDVMHAVEPIPMVVGGGSEVEAIRTRSPRSKAVSKDAGNGQGGKAAASGG